MFHEIFKEITEVSDQRKTEIFDALMASIDENKILIKMQFNNLLNNLVPPQVIQEGPEVPEVLEAIPEDREAEPAAQSPEPVFVSYTNENLVLGFMALHALDVIEKILTPEEGPGTPAQDLYWGVVRVLARLYHLQTRTVEP